MGHAPSPAASIDVTGGYNWWYLKTKRRRNQIYGFVVLSFLFTLSLILLLNRPIDHCLSKRKCSCDLIVPDVIHFYRDGRSSENMTGRDAACIRSALRHHPAVRIHSTDPLRTSQSLALHQLLSPRLAVSYPPLGPGPVHLDILREYGGMFLKNDIYLVSRLDSARGHELCTIGRGEDIVAGTREGAAAPGLHQVKLAGILLDKDYGALYIREVLKNCSYSAVRLDIR